MDLTKHIYEIFLFASSPRVSTFPHQHPVESPVACAIPSPDMFSDSGDKLQAEQLTQELVVAVLGHKSLSYMSLPYMSLPHMSLSQLSLWKFFPTDKKMPTCPYGNLSLH